MLSRNKIDTVRNVITPQKSDAWRTSEGIALEKFDVYRLGGGALNRRHQGEDHKAGKEGGGLAWEGVMLPKVKINMAVAVAAGRQRYAERRSPTLKRTNSSVSTGMCRRRLWPQTIVTSYQSLLENVLHDGSSQFSVQEEGKLFSTIKKFLEF
ncbi:hypothetical protein LSTR_LSTR002763 [Laodelphax striatellus]|uniref:Uncharacterized protein n=1 Tax=Laodelphax striatellus TaxID=195883 RepID=A0A482WND6_LAOST|nr:hypothetical protein LSTR_LSTR002763 [Laodelphax striatellus]